MPALCSDAGTRRLLRGDLTGWPVLLLPLAGTFTPTFVPLGMASPLFPMGVGLNSPQLGLMGMASPGSLMPGGGKVGARLVGGGAACWAAGGGVQHRPPGRGGGCRCRARRWLC